MGCCADPGSAATAMPTGSGRQSAVLPVFLLPPAACEKFTSKLSIARATFDRSAHTISILAPITPLASGDASITLHAAGLMRRSAARASPTRASASCARHPRPGPAGDGDPHARLPRRRRHALAGRAPACRQQPVRADGHAAHPHPGRAPAPAGRSRAAHSASSARSSSSSTAPRSDRHRPVQHADLRRPLHPQRCAVPGDSSRCISRAAARSTPTRCSPATSRGACAARWSPSRCCPRSRRTSKMRVGLPGEIVRRHLIPGSPP